MKLITLVMAPMYQGGAPSGGDNFFINLCIGRQTEVQVLFSGSPGCSYIKPGVVVHTPPYMFKRILGLSKISDLILLSVFAITFVLYLKVNLRNQKVSIKTCYVASDFLPDVLGGICAKLCFGCKLVNCIFLMAPKLCAVKARDIPVAVCYIISQYLTHFFIRRISDLLFFCSGVTRDIFLEKGIKKQSHILIHGGVEDPDLNSSVLARRDYSSRKKYFFSSVFFARLHPQKGVLNAINIWKYIAKDIPEARFAIIGEGPELEASRQLAKRLKIFDRIEWLGYVSQEELKSLAKNIKTVVHPVNYDTGGMAPIELTKFGIPMLCFEHPGMRDMFGDLAIYVPYPAVEELAEKILEVLRDEREFHRLSRRSFELSKPFYWRRVRSYFSRELARNGIVL